MKNTFYKPIQRSYFDPDTEEVKFGRFIAMGQWANGNLAYSRIDMAGEPLSDDDYGTWIQTRYGGKLCMFHI